MHALLGPYLAAALLLVVAGAPKVRHPDEALRSARETGLPATALIVRLFGVVEVGIGLSAVLVGGAIPAVLVGLSYLGFALFVLRGLIRKDLTSCGCFSGDDSPPSAMHVVLDAALAAVAIAVAASSENRWLGTGRSTGQIVLLGALAVLDAALLYLVLARLPHAGSRRSTPEVAAA